MSHDKSATEERALALLGQGLSTGVVASALGVTDARVSQMLSDPVFAGEVQKLRFQSLQQSTAIDGKYNELEDKLLDKLHKVMPLITRPRDILQAINTVNNAKRRGQSAPDTDALQSKVVQLSMPTLIQQKFVTNNFQQVTEVRDESGNSQSLVTANSASVDKFASKMLQERLEARESKELIESSSTEVTSEGSEQSTSYERETSLKDLL